VRGDGRIYLRGSVYWISYPHRGQNIREAGGRTDQEARRKLKRRLAEIQGENFVGPRAERVTVNELLDDLLTHLRTSGAKCVQPRGSGTAAPILSHLRPIREYFGTERAINVSSQLVERYQSERLSLGKSRSTVNREVAALRQAFNLGKKRDQVMRVPYFPMLKEPAARQGFFEREEFESVVSQLDPPFADAARFSYLTGWRKAEVFDLHWDQIDRSAREARLATSKNGLGRVVPLEGSLWEIVERRWHGREYLMVGGVSGLSELVFHRSGQPLGEGRKAWKNACKSAGYPGKLFHDLRRTAVRNMVRAGVPQAVAMSISGHRTTSMFQRYNITSEADKRSALLRTQQYLSDLPTSPTWRPFPRTGTKEGQTGEIEDGRFG
jgi:integrase